MSRLLETAVSGSCAGHELIDDPDWVQEEQLIINKLSAKCQVNIAALKSQLPEHIPEALQKLENFFIEPLIVFDGVPYQWFNFTPSIHDQPNDLTTIKNMLAGIIELTQKDLGISAIEILDTKVLDKLDWLRDSLLRFLNRLAGHGGYIHRLPEPDTQYLSSKYESLRNHVEHWILLEKGSENIWTREFSTLQERLIDGILLRKDRFQRSQAHYKTVMGTSTLKGKGREQSRFKSPIQGEFTLDMYNIPECPDITIDDPYRTCPCCFQSIPGRYVQSPCRWREHVIKSLHLYMCIAEDCSEGDQLFLTEKSLWAHIQACHSKWECSFCDASFPNSSKLRSHLGDHHKSQFDETDDLSPEYQVYRPVLGLRSCPLCPFTSGEDSYELVTHVISHMYEFSFNFLPWIEPCEAGEAQKVAGWIAKLCC